MQVAIEISLLFFGILAMVSGVQTLFVGMALRGSSGERYRYGFSISYAVFCVGLGGVFATLIVQAFYKEVMGL
jgi:hypothetical protein